jgi:hypothetical protein
MTTKPSMDLIMVPLAMIMMVLGVFALQTVKISLNGRVCNHSSKKIWLTVTESGRQKAFPLASGQCTDDSQDAKSIWGSDCRTGNCQYQAWKVGAGHYDVKNGGSTVSGAVLRIHGWGAGSSWHITREWPKPELSSIHYLLVR